MLLKFCYSVNYMCNWQPCNAKFKKNTSIIVKSMTKFKFDFLQESVKKNSTIFQTWHRLFFSFCLSTIRRATPRHPGWESLCQSIHEHVALSQAVLKQKLIFSSYFINISLPSEEIKSQYFLFTSFCSPLLVVRAKTPIEQLRKTQFT